MKWKNYFLLPCILFSKIVAADTTAIDKIYHPYVQPLEREVGLRMISDSDETSYRLSLGRAFTERLFLETYLTASDRKKGDPDIDGYELEATYQLTEQGEYWADWGLVFDLEKKKSISVWEFSTAVLVEKEWKKWVATANFWGIYEWGTKIDDELESALALQVRYRYSRFFEPAVELYSGENTRGLGPVVLGNVRFGRGKKLHWEIGAIIGLDSKTPNSTWRFLTEFEF